MFRLVILLLLISFGITGSAQTVINVDLTASPNITKTFSGYTRSGTNCGGSNCIVFNVTVNPGSDLVSFSASQITGASFYTIDCGVSTPIGTPACISGKTQFSLSFCKPGGNDVVYTLSASTAVRANDDLTVRQGCPADLSVTGLDPASTSWTSIFPGTPGAYNSFLSCTTGCTTTTFTAGTASPDYIDYKVSGISAACPNAKSDIVRVYVTPPMSVNFEAGSTVICSGGAATLSATAIGGNAPYRYTWTKDGSPLANTSSSIDATDVGTYTVAVTDNTNCLPVSQSVTVTAAPTPPAPTVNISNASICSGTATSLTATAPGGTYQWFSSSSGGTPLFTGATYTTPVLTITTTYYVQTLLNGCTSARSAVTINVNPIPAAPSASGTTICSGNTAALTTTAPGGNYEWYDAASGGNLLTTGADYNTGALIATTTYYVQTTVGGCTSPRRAVTVTVTPTPQAPTADGTTVCSGSSASLSTTAPGGNYEWFDMASGGTAIISGSTFTTPALTESKTYYVQTTINGCTSPRTAVIINVNAIPSAPTVNGTSICEGTATSLTATAPGGTYQWFSSSSGGTPFFIGSTYTTPVLTNNTTYYVQTLLNGCASARSAVTIIVNPVPAAPSALGTTICSGNTSSLTATAPGGNYEWYDAASGGNLLTTGAGYNTGALNATTTYYVQTTIGGCTSVRRAVTVTVTPTPQAPTADGTTICSGSSASLSTTTPGGNYEWFDVASGGTAIISGSTFTTPPLTVSRTYYVQTTINGCISPRTAVTVTINPLPAAPTATGVTICEGNQTTLTATGPGGTYRWFDASSAGNLLHTGASYSTPNLATTTIYYVESVSVLGCTGPRTAVTVEVIPAVNPAFFYPSGTFCITGSNPTPTLAGPAGTFSSTTGLIIDATTGEIDVSRSTLGTYAITFSTSTTCIYTSTVSVTITDSPNAIFSFPVFCQGQSAQALPIFTAGASAGQFTSSDPGLVFLSRSTGEIDLLASTPGTYTVTNTIAASGGCDAAAESAQVVIKPTPKVISAATATICSGAAHTYAIMANLGTTTTFTWSRAAVAGINIPGIAGQTNPSITEELVNTTLVPINVVYLIVPSANGCDGPTFTYRVTVNPEPKVTTASTGSICNRTAQSYRITGNFTGIQFTWSRAAVDGISNEMVSGQPGTVITEALVNTTTSPINVAYSIIPSADGCPGAEFIYNLTVNPTPLVTSATTAVLCSAVQQNYAITSNVSGTTFTWSRNAVTGISNIEVIDQNTSVINETLLNTTSAPIDVVYSILPSANGCDGPVFSYKVTVNPIPRITSAATATICDNTVQNYTIMGSFAGTTFNWSRLSVDGISNPPAIGQTNSTISEALINSTSAPVDVIYQITPFANGCAGPVFTYTITVNPTPKVNSATAGSICNGSAQNYTITGPINGTTFIWSRAAVTGILNNTINQQNGNSITETLVNTTASPINVAYIIVPWAGGCSGPAFIYTLTVNPTPVVNSPSMAAICSNVAQDYTITSGTPGATFTWSRNAVNGISNPPAIDQNNPSISETLINTMSTPVDVVYQITPFANGCAGPVFSYLLSVKPTPQVNSEASTTICSNTAQNYVINSTIAGTTFRWSRADVTGIVNPGVSAQTSDIINEVLVNSTSSTVDVVYQIIPTFNGCDGPAFNYTLSVNPTPVVTSGDRGNICNATIQQYIITSNVSSATFTWSRPVFAGISNTAISGRASSTITEALINTTRVPVDVTYVIEPSANGCNGPTFNYTVTVNPTPGITNSNLDQTICSSGTTIAFTPESDVQGATFEWTATATAGITGYVSSGTGTIPAQTIASPAGGGTITYQIVPSSSGCKGIPGNYTIAVLNQVPLMPSVGNSGPICVGESLSLSVESVTGASYSWSGPDSFSSGEQNPVIQNTTLANEGLYTVIVTVGPCSATANTTVVLNKPAFVTVMNDQTVCADNASVRLSGNVSGGSTSGSWTSSGTGSFTAGASTLNGTYLPSEADKATGKVTLTLTATNTAACLAAAKSVNITIIPAAIVDAGADQTICAYESVVLRGSSTASQIRWASSGSGTFIPGSNSLTAQYLPGNADKLAGNVTITLTASVPGCTPVSDQMKVAIVQPPVLKLEPEIYAYSDESITLNPEVSGNDLQYLWMPNRGLNNNTVKSPVFTGTENIIYTLTVTGTGGCKVSREILVKILAPVKIPNAFSPNGDGINDTWKASGLETYPGVAVSVYNRYGVQVYSGFGTSEPWDGTFKGNPLPVGVYYYVFRFVKFSNPLTGSLTIIR